MEVWGINSTASIMIVFIIIVRSLGLYKLPKYIFICLWGLVIIRLLLPVSISLPISIPMELSNPIVRFYERETSVKESSDRQINNSMDEDGNTVILSERGDLQQLNYLEIIKGIRIIGTMVFMMLFLISFSRSFYKIRDSLPADNEEIKKWQQCNNNKLKIYRPLEIRISDRIGSPLTMGIIKPKIIIPTTFDLTDKNSLDYILMHEFIHVKRFDILLKAVLNIIVCYYWYNPLIWTMYILCNRDIELACDEKVISIFGKGNRTEYAHVLLTMSEQRNGMFPTCRLWKNSD